MTATRLLVLTVGICVTSLLSSCSDDDKFSYEAGIELEPDLQKTINGVMQRSKCDMAAADFKDLTLLTEALKNGMGKLSCLGNDSTKVQQFFDNSWDFSNMPNILQQLFNLGLDSLSFDVVVNDTLTYNIAFSIESDSTMSLVGADDEAHHKLTIGRNGEQMLVIDTQQNSGSLEYQDMRFVIDRTQYDLDSLVTNLVYSKADSEVLGIKMKSENNFSLGNLLLHNVVFKGALDINIGGGSLKLENIVDNMNKFYLASIGLAGMGIAGTSQAKCQQQADAFNDVVNSRLSLFNVEVGKVMMEPVTTDSISNLYRPALVLQPTGDSNKIILNDFFEAMGLTFKDIIEMITGD